MEDEAATGARSAAPPAGRLLAACAGRGFEARRDRALILLLLDSGGRRAEIAGMRLGDVNEDQRCRCQAPPADRSVLTQFPRTL